MINSMVSFYRNWVEVQNCKDKHMCLLILTSFFKALNSSNVEIKQHKTIGIDDLF